MRLLALVTLLALPAAAMDPRFVWETLDTPHFEVHYHQGMYRYAQKIARMAELSHRRLAPLLDHEPSVRTQIVVQDDTDFANGNATPLLYPQIHAYAAPPDSRSTLADFDDNVYELISHEYTHILHLDTTLGLPDAVNDVFGKLWITNGEQPIWFIEGIATFAESEVSASGRVRSSEEDMVVRAMVLANKLFPLDVLSNVPLQWPRGFGQYTVGSRFLEWIRDQYGLGALRDLSHDFAARAVPFALNLSAERVLRKTYIELYKEFAADELARASKLRDEVRKEGETQIEPLTQLGEWVRAPRFSPDGSQIYFSHSGADEVPELRVLPGNRVLATLWSDGAGDDTVSVGPDGTLVFAREEVFQEYEDIQDLFSLDAAGEHRLTRGLRARNPDVARDGAVAFLWRKPGGRTAIGILEPSGATHEIYSCEEPVDTPRFSPDGKRIAFLEHRDGAWDLRVMDRDGSHLLDVTHDRALDRDPAWSPDGKYLLFSSDRTEIYNIYAYDVASRDLYQVTNVVIGAFEPQPSPDQKTLALVTYSERGYDVGRMPFDPATWKPVTARADADEDRPPVTPLPPEENFPSHPYNPLPTLRPHGWLPYASSDAYGTTLGAITQGFDAVDRHEYTAALWWSTSGSEPGFDIRYTNRTLYPAISLEAIRDLGSPNASGARASGYYYEREVGAVATVDFPFSMVERGQNLSLSYELLHLAVDQNPLGVATSPGHLAAAQLTYSFSNAFRFVNSVSAERGGRFALSLRLSDPSLGSTYSFWQLTGRASKFLLAPWGWHHALGVQIAGGISHGDFSNRHRYDLGGFQQGNLVRAVINPAGAPANVLRGFAIDAFEGEAYVLGTAEYRFPIWNVETGAWTLPAYLRRIHAALFTDVGDAFTPRLHDFKLHAGAGAELRAEIVLGWILPTDLRFGCARGLENSRYAILDCYAALGGEF